MLASTRYQKPSDAVHAQTTCEDCYKRYETLRVERVIGEVRLGDRFQIELLALGFEAGRFERGECRAQRLFGELAVEAQAFIFGQTGDHRVALAAQLGALLGDQLVERGDAGLDQRD